MSKRRMARNPVSDLERWRIALLAEFGFHYRTIAARLYGNGNPDYKASDGEAARVGRVAREEGVSSLDWRRGQNSTATSVLNRVSRATEKPKLKLVAKSVA